jgi:hypothetical protein
MNQDPKNDIVNCSSSYFPAIELNVRDTLLTENDESLINQINPMFNMIQITCLDIECDQMSVSMLITILCALENLNSIRLSNSPLRQEMNLSTRDKINFNGFLNINKITKLNLQNVDEQDQIDFAIQRFPRLRFLRLERVRDIQLKLIVRDILLNIKDNNISHPMTIYPWSKNTALIRP